MRSLETTPGFWNFYLSHIINKQYNILSDAGQQPEDIAPGEPCDCESECPILYMYHPAKLHVVA